jgi:hypothetical protein
MKATPVLNYAVPKSVKDLQEKMHGKAGEHQAVCTCTQSSNTNLSGCSPCACGNGYAAFI